MNWPRRNRPIISLVAAMAFVGLWPTAGAHGSSMQFSVASERQEAPRFVWWEGEDYADTNLPEPEEVFPAGRTPQESAKLSGGTWLLTRGAEGGGPYYITWKVPVPHAGQYNLWVRKFWRHGPFRWRFDDGEWRLCGRNVALHDDTYLRQFTGANWVFLGAVELKAGTHELRAEMIEPVGGGAIDCFALVDGPFMPRGKLKPGQKSGLAMPGHFAWEPDPDPLDEDCPIDLRHLNEDHAGQHGFVRRQGNGFVLGNGDPVRFWMVQGDALMRMKPQMVDYWARRLSKYGVNLVRLGMLELFNSWRSAEEDAFQQKLDRLHYVVAALKREGIYTYLGHLWWHTSVSVSEADGVPGYGDGMRALGMLYFVPEGREFYLRWVDALLNAQNPHTGLPLAREPAVAVIEIHNESSLFFWTFRPRQMEPPARMAMEKRFAEWAAQKYGSVQAALDAWGSGPLPVEFSPVSVDLVDEGRLGLYPVGNLTVNDWAPAQRNPKRASDQLEFMTQWQYDFYKDMIRDWRQDLGVQTMISCSNWKTADPRNLGVLERYLYTAGDVICRNVYYDVEYDPRPERFYAVDLGDTYTEYSALKPPMFPAPFTIAHVNDYPDMYTENNWCRPNRFRVEWPFLVAAYGPMMGMDGWTFFALDTPLWTSQMSVWEVNCPSVLGQFPAAALIFRKGYVQEAPTAVAEHMSLQDLYEFSQAALFEMGGKDALWESRIGALEGAADRAKMQIDRLAFFVGKVDRILGEGPSGIETVDLEDYIDHEAQTVRSLTGEQQWDFSRGVVTLNTPYAQGACGFLEQAGTLDLDSVAIESANEYGSVLVVSLDGQPLNESDRLLIQAGTEDRPHGFATEPVDGKKRITELGGYPMNVRRVRARVTLKDSASRTATVLDANGYPTGEPPMLNRTAGGTVITLPEDALYVLVE